MTQSTAALSACWTVLKSVEDVVKLLDQNTPDTRALKFLKTKVKSFLEVVSVSLLDQDVTLYEPTIKSFEVLIRDVLDVATNYFSISRVDDDRERTSSADMKTTILELNKRLQPFFDVYTFQSATSAQLNLSAFAQPLSSSSFSSSSPLIPDDIQWAIMCEPENPGVWTKLVPDLTFPLGGAEGISPPKYTEATHGQTMHCPSGNSYTYVSGDHVVHYPPVVNTMNTNIRDSDGTGTTPGGAPGETDEMKCWQAGLLFGLFPISIPAIFCYYFCLGFCGEAN